MPRDYIDYITPRDYNYVDSSDDESEIDQAPISGLFDFRFNASDDASLGKSFANSGEAGQKFDETKLSDFKKYMEGREEKSHWHDLKQLFTITFGAPGLPLKAPAEDLLLLLIEIHKKMINCAEEVRSFSPRQKIEADIEMRRLLLSVIDHVKCTGSSSDPVVTQILDQSMSEKFINSFLEKYPDNKNDLEKYLAFSKYKNYLPTLKKIEEKQNAKNLNVNTLIKRLDSQAAEINSLKSEVSVLREQVLQQQEMLSKILSRLPEEPSISHRSTSPKIFGK